MENDGISGNNENIPKSTTLPCQVKKKSNI